MPGRCFIDSNIFIYAKIDRSGEIRHQKSREFLKSFDGEIIVSIQVLNEFYNVLNRYKIGDDIIQANINGLACQDH